MRAGGQSWSRRSAYGMCCDRIEYPTIDYNMVAKAWTGQRADARRFSDCAQMCTGHQIFRRRLPEDADQSGWGSSSVTHQDPWGFCNLSIQLQHHIEAPACGLCWRQQRPQGAGEVPGCACQMRIASWKAERTFKSRGQTMSLYDVWDHAISEASAMSVPMCRCANVPRGSWLEAVRTQESNYWLGGPGLDVSSFVTNCHAQAGHMCEQ